MTDPQTAEMINDQIRLEFRKLNSILTDESDKPAIISRIADLKAMLDDDPKVPTEAKMPSIKEIAIEAIKAYRYRY